MLNRYSLFFAHSKAVHPDDNRFFKVDRLLIFIRGILDFLLHIAAFNRLQHSAHGLYFF